MLRDNVSVGGSDLERAVWEVDLDVFAEVTAEPFLFARTAEVSQVFLEPRYLQQLALGTCNVSIDNNIVKKNAPNIVVVYAAGRTVFGAIFACSGPKVSL
jgi:hypothetical protein